MSLGLCLALEGLSQKKKNNLGGASPKIAIPYRKFFENEPLQANFKGRGPGRAPGCLQASGKLLQCGKLSWGGSSKSAKLGGKWWEHVENASCGKLS